MLRSTLQKAVCGIHQRRCLTIENCTTTEHPITVNTAHFRGQGQRVMGPMKQVCARGVTPMNSVPDVTVRIVLIKKVVASPHENQAVGVVHPAVGGQKVIVGSVRVRLSLGL